MQDVVGVGATSLEPTARTIDAVEATAHRLILVVVPLWLAPVIAAANGPETLWAPRDTLVAVAAASLGYLLFWWTRQPAYIVGSLISSTLWLAAHHPKLHGATEQDLILEQWVNLAAWSTGIIVTRARRGVVLVIGSVASVAGVLVALSNGNQVALDVEAIAALVAYALTDGLAAVAAFAVMRRSARHADHELELASRAAAALEMQRARQHELRRISRLMHDTVVNTLCAVQLWEHTDAPQLRGRAAADLQLLQSLQPSARTSPAALVAACRQRASLLGLDLACQAAEILPDIPANVAAAIEGACWEALTNVAKHSGTHFAAMKWSVDGDEIRVEIRDHGVGFNTERRVGHGLTESVFARCAEVGVRASVVSSPGSGTSMRLRWNPTSEIDVDPIPATSTPLEPGLAASVGWIAIALGLFSFGAMLRAGLGPLQSWSGVAAFAVLMLVYAATLRAFRTSHVVRPPAVFYVIAGAILVALPSLGVHGCVRVGTWWWGPFGGVLLGSYVAILDARRTAILATIAGTALGYFGAIASLVDGTDKCRQDTLAFLVLQSGIIAGLGAARRRHASIHAIGQLAADETHRDRVRYAHEAATQRARQRHVEFARSIAEPVLAGLADGTTSAEDPAVRGAAARAESTLRLVATLDALGADVAAAALSDAVIEAHAKGLLLHVSFTSDGLPCEAQAPALRDALRSFLEACPPGRSAQLTLLGGGSVVCVLYGTVDDSSVSRLRSDGWTATQTDRQLLLERTLGEV